MNSQQTIQKQNPSKPVIVMDSNLEQTMIDETLKLGDMSTLDAAKQTTDVTENISFGVEQKLKECYEEIARLKTEKGSLMDDVTKLSEQSDNYKKQIEQLQMEIEQMKEAAASTHNAVADQMNLIDFDLSMSTENSKWTRASSDQTDTDHEKLENQYSEYHTTVAEFEGIEDYQSWKKSAEDAEGLVRDLQTALKEEKQRYSDVKFELDKTKKDEANAKKDCDDYVWMFEQERKQHSTQLKQLQLRLVELEQNNNSENFESVECQTEQFKNERIGVLEMELEQLTSKVTEIGVERDGLSVDCEKSERHVFQMETVIAEQQSAISALEGTVELLTQQLDSFEKMIEEDRLLKVEAVDYLEQLELFEKENTAELEAKDAQIKEYSERIEHLEKELAGNLVTSDTCAILEKRLGEMELELTTKAQCVKDMEGQRDRFVKSSKERLAQMQALVEEKEIQKVGFKNIIEKLNERLNLMRQESEMIKVEAVKGYVEQIELLEKAITDLRATSEKTAELQAKLCSSVLAAKTKEIERLSEVGQLLRKSKRRLEGECDKAD